MAECIMFSLTYEAFMPSVVMLNVVMLSVAAPSLESSAKKQRYDLAPMYLKKISRKVRVIDIREHIDCSLPWPVCLVLVE